MNLFSQASDEILIPLLASLLKSRTNQVSLYYCQNLNSHCPRAVFARMLHWIKYLSEDALEASSVGIQ